MEKAFKMSAVLNEVLNKKVGSINKMLKPLNWMAVAVGINIEYGAVFRNRLKLLNIFLIIISLCGLGGQYYFIWEHRSKTFFVYTDAICTSFQTVITYSKLYRIFFSLHEFQKLLRMAKNLEILQDLEVFELNILNKKQLTKEISSILDDSWRDIRRQICIYITFVSGTVCWFNASSLVINYYNTYIDPKDPNEFYLLFPFQGSYPFWRDKGLQFPYYYIVFIFSSSEIYLAGYTAVTFVGLYISMLLHTLALLKILRRIIENSTTENVLPQDRVKYMLAWTRLYQRIYQYYYQINSLYYIQSAPLFLVSMLVLCCLIYQASVGLGTDITVVVKNFLYLATASFEVFMFCINGQRLTTESEKLSVAIYNSKWYEESEEFKLFTRMMIMRTNRAFVMEVAGFTTMSRLTYLGILRTSFSFFLLLNEMNNR